jgi:hypothetical protein
VAGIASDDSTDDIHITVGISLNPHEALCGATVAECGDLLSRFKAEWPVLDFAWCEACVKAYAPI